MKMVHDQLSMRVSDIDAKAKRAFSRVKSEFDIVKNAGSLGKCFRLE